jgi:hypothetical protein
VLLRRTAGRGDPSGVPLDALAAALTSLRTSRCSSYGIYAFHDGDRAYAVEGFSDHASGRMYHRGHIGEVPTEHIVSDDRWFERLSPEQEERLGKKWGLRQDPCRGHRLGGWREVAAAVRAAPPSTVRSAAEDGLRRLTIPLAPSPRSADPVLAHMAAHLRRHGIMRIRLDVWTGDDLDIRRVRTYYRRLRSVRVMPLAEATSDHWDFGVPVEIGEPDAADVVPGPKPTASCWGYDEP